MKKIKKWFFNLNKLLAFTILIIPMFALVCILGSWTYNQYNSTSDNLVSYTRIGHYNSQGIYDNNDGWACTNLINWSQDYESGICVSINAQNISLLRISYFDYGNNIVSTTNLSTSGFTYINNINYIYLTNISGLNIAFNIQLSGNYNGQQIVVNRGITPIPYQPNEIPNYKSTAQVDNIFYKTNYEHNTMNYDYPNCEGCTPYNSTCSFSVKGGLSNNIVNQDINCIYAYTFNLNAVNYTIPQGNYYFWFNRYNKECYPTLFFKDKINQNNYFYVSDGSFTIPNNNYTLQYIYFNTSDESSDDFCIIDLYLFPISSPTSDQYNNLDNNYQNYRDTHSYTNEQYSSLQQSYNNISSAYSSLQQDYNNLRSNYNALLDSYNSLANVGSVIPGSYTINIASQNGSVTNYDFTINATLDSDLYIDALGYLKVNDIYNDFIESQQYGNVILITLNESVSALNYDLMFNVNGAGNNINLMVNFDSFTPPRQLLFGLDNNGNPLTLTNFIKYQDAQVSNILNYSYNQFALVYTNAGNDLSNIKLNGQGDYNLGYVNGLAQNNQDFLELQQDYDTLNNNYNSLQQSYDTLHARYDEIADTDLGFSMTKLVWSIAATPFESFKSIWSVDFLDFNIASFVTGILSIFVIVWLLKKIF